MSDPANDDSDGDSEFPDPVTAIHDMAALRKSLATDKQGRDRHILVCVHGDLTGRVFALEKEVMTIGRAPDSEIWIHADGLSRHHAKVERMGDYVVVEDCSSANGTFVNGKRIDRQPLSDGDVVHLGGDVSLRYSLTDRDNEKMLVSLFEASVRDPLTRAYNRDYLDERLKSEISFASRHRSQLAVVMIDLDHFKRINDNYGHPAGDQVLVHLVEVIKLVIRLEDVLVRYGGEEFAAVLRGIDIKGATFAAERIRATIEQVRFSFRGEVVKVTASFGCATLGCVSEKTPETLIETADRRLFVAKRTGRNRVVSQD